MALVDLDAELIRIRDFRSRLYFSDALKAYRAGAFRAAISSAWVALAYDLLRKYRELNGLGDQEARTFLTTWDNAVQAKDVAKLLESERALLDHAHLKTGIIDAMGLRTLKRLYDDRHLSAHPAFANQDELYEPTDELVRTHLAAAVELVLAQRPVQGKGIFEAFSADIQSPGFPNAEQTIIDYVEQKYLVNMRNSVLRNFGIVLGKSLIQNKPPEWESLHSKVMSALVSLKLRRPADWDSVATELVKMINDDDPTNRLRCVATLTYFPELVARLEHPALTALKANLLNDATVVATPQAFAAVEIKEFENELQARFEVLDDTEAATVLSVTSPLPLWQNSLSRYGNSRNYRSAERHFDQFILPFQTILEESQLTELFAVVQNNSQIWDAAGTPTQIANLLQTAHPNRPTSASIDALYGSNWGRLRESFDLAWTILEQRGWERPAAQPADEDDPFGVMS